MPHPLGLRVSPLRVCFSCSNTSLPPTIDEGRKDTLTEQLAPSRCHTRNQFGAGNLKCPPMTPPWKSHLGFGGFIAQSLLFLFVLRLSIVHPTICPAFRFLQEPSVILTLDSSDMIYNCS